MELNIPKLDEYSLSDLLRMEKETVGIYISGHPMSQYSIFAKARKFPTIIEVIEKSKERLNGFCDGDNITILAMLQGKKLYTTRSNTQMCFIAIEDMTGSMEGVVFPKIFDEYRAKLKEGDILELFGHISLKDEEDAKLLVDKISIASDFVESCKRMNICIKTNSTNKEIIDKIIYILNQDIGSSKVYFYFSDLEKLTAPKGFTGVNVNEKTMKLLVDEVSDENIALM